MPSRTISERLKTNPDIRSRVVLLAITILATVIFLATIIYMVYHLWDTLFRRSRTNPFDTTSNSLKKLRKFSYKELKSATNQFNQENSIGKGGSGCVFRGILRNGKSVAIKKLDAASSLQAEKEFQSELTILGSFRSSHIVSLLGYCVEKNKRLLVYEYMPNRSLQEFLFCDENGNNHNNSNTISLGCLNWERRFQIIQDVARALEFLHNECEPPVIHGDIKPSNVLLDWDFKAKISDFGLSRVKVEDDVGIDMFSQDLWKSQELSGNLNGEITPPVAETPKNHTGGDQCSSGEVDFALALQSSCSSKNGRGLQNCSSRASPKGKGVIVEDQAVGECDQELFSSVERSKELELNPSVSVEDVGCVKTWGKDWWWKQEDNGELCSKEYVNEWIGTQVGASANRDWDSMDTALDNLPESDELKEDKGPPVAKFQLGCVDEKKIDTRESTERGPRKSKPRKMQDWWKAELMEEISKKGGKRKCLKSKMRKTLKMPHFGLGRRFSFLKRRSSSGETNHNDYERNHREFSFKKGWRRKNALSMGSDMSGDLFSRDLSSTTSMRGTLCYVAPEYGGCGYLMEKGDIYSLGVLILVILSGRRPLHVLNSPMKLEKANLVSWCRHLAQAGNVLELVDDRLKDAYDEDQVTLCIHLALACLQRVPELRPDIGDIVRILRGEMDLSPLPFDFSPSPPSKFYNKSMKKTW